jgi:transposase InsO family protein
MVENQRKDGLKIQCRRMDGAKEFQSGDVVALCKASGISVELSAAHQHQQNGRAERVNRTLIEMGRTMMVESGLPESFWAEAIRTAVYLKNRLPSKSSPKGTIRKKKYRVWTVIQPTRLTLRHVCFAPSTRT